jgi:hypothetical protein
MGMILLLKNPMINLCSARVGGLVYPTQQLRKEVVEVDSSRFVLETTEVDKE